MNELRFFCYNKLNPKINFRLQQWHFVAQRFEWIKARWMSDTCCMKIVDDIESKTEIWMRCAYVSWCVSNVTIVSHSHFILSLIWWKMRSSLVLLEQILTDKSVVVKSMSIQQKKYNKLWKLKIKCRIFYQGYAMASSKPNGQCVRHAGCYGQQQKYSVLYDIQEKPNYWAKNMKQCSDMTEQLLKHCCCHCCCCCLCVAFPQ